jgi:threonine dehydrogenase-like Zn-dependent dehydrogenase
MKMRAAVFEKPDVITVKEIPVPEINDNEVLIKVKYTGICGTDWNIYKGYYSADKLPMVAGHEFSGVIAKMGKNAQGLKEGDRVTADINLSCGVCFYCRRGQKLMCPEFTQLGIHTNGSYAEYVKAPWEQVHILPDNMDFLQGAFIEPVSCVIHSSKSANVKIGSSVAVIGCGLGILHSCVAMLRGAAPVIIFGDNEKRLQIARDMGVDYAININEKPDMIAETRKLTGGRGADYVIEAVGNPKTYEAAFKMVRPGGTVTAFGIVPEDKNISINPYDLVLGEKSVASSCAGVGVDWLDSMALLAHGRIKPEKMFSMVVPLEELESALNELKTNPDLIKVFVSAEIKERKIL